MDRDGDNSRYTELLDQLPWSAPIYLPTDALSDEQKVAGLERVVDIHTRQLDKLYRPKLEALREKYAGRRRAFIIGNGPSLNKMDLSFLKDEVTFCVNGFFLKFPELDWRPTFHVVEDHLVAEDRAEEINALRGITKLYPAYLGYCLEPGPETIYFNHRARKSYPHAFDFSTDAASITYTGCTVTFTCLQLAHYLGFRELFLIGVDADYSIPDDAKHSDDYGTGVLDMGSDDPNHFHPDYFGKGKRWHDPQVDKMLEAYQEARGVIERTGCKVYNATVGGKLEVFPRRDYTSLFPSKTETTPRLLVVDMTPVGGVTATGALKQTLLEGWPTEHCMHISSDGISGFACQGGPVAPHEPAAIYTSAEEAARLAGYYQPDLILYRPLPEKPQLHALLNDIAAKTGAPVVSWIMDDWLARLETTDQAKHADWLGEIKRLTKDAPLNLSISEAMSEELETRLGRPFTAFANGIDPAEWSEPVEGPGDTGGPVTIRYAGGLAEDMTLATVLEVARSVEELDGPDVRLEINTRQHWFNRHDHLFSGLKRTSLSVAELSREEYIDWLKRADILLLAYNFDEASLRYVRYSMANKLPELLASGKPVLAIGPAEQATIAFLGRSGLAVRVTEPGRGPVDAAVASLLADPAARKALGSKAREFALDELSLETIRPRFQKALISAARPSDAPRADVSEKAIYSLVRKGQERHVDPQSYLPQQSRLKRIAKFYAGWRGAVAGLGLAVFLVPLLMFGVSTGWLGRFALVAPVLAGAGAFFMIGYLYTVLIDHITILEKRLEAVERRAGNQG